MFLTAAFVAVLCYSAPDEVILNPVCRDPERAPILCDESARLFDLSIRCERAFDTCQIEKDGLERKLLVRSTTTAPGLVRIERVEVTPDWVWPVLGVLGGIAVGGVTWALLGN